MARPVSKVEVTEDERSELERRVKASTTAKRDVLRAEIVLKRADGNSQQDVASQLGVSVACVNKWSQRFEHEGLVGLKDRPGRGRKPSIPLETVERVVTEVTRPPKPRTRWSVRSMAREVGISPDSVNRIWRDHDIKPHLTRTFKVSEDPRFEEKFWDVIGLYLNPPERALVLCCDEKSQCQALERTQPGLPLGVGQVATRTHDYRRHGTVTLFAALNYLDGKLIQRTEQRHTHVEWLRFLKQIDRETPAELEIHVVLDNYATHKHAEVQRWLERHPRFKMHYTPTGSSWLNLVERFFGELTQEVIRDGSFSSINELIRDIEAYIVERNLNPKPYVWKARGEEILRKIYAARAALDEAKANRE